MSPYAQPFHYGAPLQQNNMLLGLAMNAMGVDATFMGNNNPLEVMRQQNEQQLRMQVGQQAIANDVAQAGTFMNSAMGKADMRLSPDGQLAYEQVLGTLTAGGIAPMLMQGMGHAGILDIAAGGMSEYNIAMGLAGVTQGAYDHNGALMSADQKSTMASILTSRLRADENYNYSGDQTAQTLGLMTRRGLMPDMNAAASMTGSPLAQSISAQQGSPLLMDAALLGSVGPGEFDAANADSQSRNAATALKDYTKQLQAANSILKDDGLKASLGEMAQLLDELGGQAGRFVGGEQSANMLRRMDQASDRIGYTTAELRGAAAAGKGMAQAAGYQTGPMGQIATTSMLEARAAYGQLGINDIDVYGMSNADQLSQSSALGMFAAQESNAGQRYAAAQRLNVSAGNNIDTSTANGRMFAAYIKSGSGEAMTEQEKADSSKFMNLSISEQNSITAQQTGSSTALVQQEGGNRRANEEYYAKNESGRNAVTEARRQESISAVGQGMTNAMQVVGRSESVSSSDTAKVADLFVNKTMKLPPTALSGENRKGTLDGIAQEIADETGLPVSSVRRMIDSGMTSYQGADGGRYEDQVALHGDTAADMRKTITAENDREARINAHLDGSKKHVGGIQGLLEELGEGDGDMTAGLTRLVGYQLDDATANQLTDDLKEADTLGSRARRLRKAYEAKDPSERTQADVRELQEAEAAAKTANDNVHKSIDGLRGADDAGGAGTDSDTAAAGGNKELTSIVDMIDKVLGRAFENVQGVSINATELVINGESTGPASGGGAASATPQADATSSATANV